MVAADANAVLVTGAAGGIGSITVDLLHSHGFRVYAGVRPVGQAADLRTRENPARDVTFVEMDVADSGSVAGAVAAVSAMLTQRNERLVGVVNMATVEYHGPLEILPLKFVRRELEVNYLGALSVTRGFLPLLRPAGGRIVNISSINGLCVFPSIGASCASKYALEAMSDALRLELRPWGLRVILIEPGAVATKLWDKTLAAFQELPSHVTPSDLHRYYPSWPQALARARRDKVRLLRLASPPQRVAETVVKALTDRRPKTRYLVGWDARAISFARWLLPDQVFDALARRTFHE